MNEDTKTETTRLQTFITVQWEPAQEVKQNVGNPVDASEDEFHQMTCDSPKNQVRLSRYEDEAFSPFSEQLDQRVTLQTRGRNPKGEAVYALRMCLTTEGHHST